MKKQLFALMLAGSFTMLSSSISAATTCQHPVKEIDACAQVTWTLGPKYGIFSKAQVKLTAKDGSALKNVPELEIYPWMKMENGHEHGARETVTKMSGPGEYEVSMIHLMKMPGEWFLRIKRPKAKAQSDYLVSIPITIAP